MTEVQSPQPPTATEVALVEAALTVPHPDLQPDLPIVTSDDVTAIAAAVSPESSYRLVGELLSALERRKDDLTVRILLSSTYRDNWEQSKASLAQFNLFQTMKAMNRDYFDHLHNKELIFDRRKVIVTSTNWSQNSVAAAREVGVLIESPAIAEYYPRCSTSTERSPSIRPPCRSAPTN